MRSRNRDVVASQRDQRFTAHHVDVTTPHPGRGVETPYACLGIGDFEPACRHVEASFALAAEFHHAGKAQRGFEAVRATQFARSCKVLEFRADSVLRTQRKRVAAGALSGARGVGGLELHVVLQRELDRSTQRQARLIRRCDRLGVGRSGNATSAQ